MILDTTTKSMEVVLGEGHVSAALDICADWADIDATTFTPGAQDVSSNGTTAVEAVPAPVIGKARAVRQVRVVNTDTGYHSVSIRLFNSLTGKHRVVLRAVSLAPSADLIYRP